MTKTIMIILYTLFSSLYSDGASIAVPAPAEMLSSADIVAVASLSKENEVWTITLVQVLKGEYSQGGKIGLSSPYSEESFSFAYLEAIVGVDEFLFVGKQQPMSRMLQPTFGICSFWPQGTIKELLPERTLSDTIAYAKKTLGISDHVRSQEREEAHSDQLEQPALPQIQPESAPLLNPTVPQAQAPKKPTEQKPELPAQSEEPESSTRWPLVAVVVVAALGLLWLLLKKRK